MSFDAIVIGAGIVGAASARALARKGLRTLVLDRAGAASGTSGQGEGNLLVSDKGPGPELELAQRAAALWPDLVAELADELGPGFPAIEYEPKGGLVIATTEQGAQPLLEFAATQRAAGVDARPLPADRALELEPNVTRDLTAAVFYPGDAQVQPVVATEALLASARKAGAVVRPGVEVTGRVVDARGRLVGVRTTRGEFTAPRVIVAAGPWSGEASARLGVPLPVRPRRGMVLVTTRMPHRVFRKVYDGDYFGATQSSDAALQTSSVVESTAAGTVLIGSSREQIGFDDRFRVDVVRGIAAKALRLFPFLAGASIMRTYGGFRPFMPDHLPVIGPDHRLGGLWHATGHEGAGIGLSLSTAELLAAQITGQRAPLDPAPFAVSRASLAPYLEEAAA
ncbi:NAD(P)/FAD-dependent oxidoreductase [Agromyces aerolatus]|uniref:NAD(P)/FAD-dependent oxidoreductase n=1 Tax=Agromyces sp. LY-1074 TaxID=3074080 RepID=UPI00285C029F|nr:MULTISPECIES: FAD-dependent oxidoreductase [unclassified Agromyces]MDR5701564.1 FAD-dependent oxidoreductase [Agromyces sp. LY-1074]MDR5707829.1 FAD-dependent oxidoreductase [Agromyces sp. LY-1358]